MNCHDPNLAEELRKARQREYDKAWRAKPENKARRREYIKAYRDNPENKAREREYDKACYAKPEVKARKREHHKAWRDNLENKERRRKADIVRKYGLPIEQYDEMLVDQLGVCKICKKECSSGKRLAVDHCHDTGRVRGLLCTMCNTALGKFKDDVVRLDRAIRYVLGVL